MLIIPPVCVDSFNQCVLNIQPSCVGSFNQCVLTHSTQNIPFSEIHTLACLASRHGALRASSRVRNIAGEVVSYWLWLVCRIKIQILHTIQAEVCRFLKKGVLQEKGGFSKFKQAVASLLTRPHHMPAVSPKIVLQGIFLMLA